ncbi:interleukin-26 [Lissotriton helveticus]
MQVPVALISCLLGVLLSFVTAEAKPVSGEAAEAKRPCPKAAMLQAIGSLHNKTVTWRHNLPKDRIIHQKLLDKELRAQFMVNCTVQDEVLSFYQSQVFGGFQAASVPQIILNTFDEIRRNLRKCISCTGASTESSAIRQLKDRFEKIKDRGQLQRRKYKAISELTVLIGWLNTFLSQ